MMIWQLLLEDASSSAYSYMHVASLVLAGSTESEALQNATNFTLSPYQGGAEGCDGSSGNVYCGVVEYDPSSSYPTPNTQVYYECAIWKNQWWANPNEIPGVNAVWIEVSECTEDPDCAVSVAQIIPENLHIYPNPASSMINISGLATKDHYIITNTLGQGMAQGIIPADKILSIDQLDAGLYVLKIDGVNPIRFMKK